MGSKGKWREKQREVRQEERKRPLKAGLSTIVEGTKLLFSKSA